MLTTAPTVAQGEVIDEPEEQERTRQLHGVKHHGGDDERHHGEHEHLVEHLGANVRQRLVQPVGSLAHEQGPLHDNLGHVRRRAERGQRGPHEEHGGDVDDVIGLELVADAPVPGPIVYSHTSRTSRIRS